MSAKSDNAWLSALTKPARLLLVEDDDSDLELFKNHLKGWNVMLDVCPSGERALDLFFLNQYAAAFIDLKLPGMNGSELFKRIRAVDRATPIAILSGYIDDNIQRDLPQFGRVTFMKKEKADISAYLKSIGVGRVAA